MKKYFIPLLHVVFLYVVYHIAPWPTAVFIYGCVTLAIQLIATLIITVTLGTIPVSYKLSFSSSVLDTFVLYLCSFTIYITSPHDIAHILAGSTTIVFCFLYYIRYKTQQLF